MTKTKTTILSAHQGDIGDTRLLHVTGIINLDAVSDVVGHVYRKRTVAVLAASVTDVEACTVTLHLGDEDGWLATADLGDWFVELQLTFLDGSELTWGPAILSVVRQGR
jgi:hypothetical protein